MIALLKSYTFFRSTFMLQIFCCTAPKCVLLNSDPVAGKANKKQSTFKYSNGIKQYFVGINWPKSSQENLSNIIILPPLACSADTRRVESLDSCYYHYILTLPSVCLCRNQDLSDPIFSNLHLPSLCPLQPQLSVLG